ncbi:MAG: pyridoxamine 5'-phosphate oxidase family protein, partial [Clostridium sp.]|nr:pyridoxamine 5'-phosphate oxidase family protein [Clostridium sp.]
MDYFKIALASGMSRTRVFAIDMEDISGKRKKYDETGREMKFGRMLE